MANPIPHVVSTSGAAGAAPSGSIPIALYGAGAGGGAVAWADVTGKPSTFAPTIGATAVTAKAGNYAPTSAEVAAGLRTKSQITALAAVAAANAAPSVAQPTKAEFDVLVTLANANKTAINAIITALKA